jgi:large subunit ribosomal protein L9
MKVLLTEDVEKLGSAGDIVTVADGYARNYLIPNQFAVKATAGVVKQADVVRRQGRRKRERIAAEMEALAKRLSGLQLAFEANAGEKGRLYGSITRDDVIEAVEARIGEEIDRRKLEMEPLRQLGLHTVAVRLSAELSPELLVIIHREGEDPEAYLVEPEAEAEPEAGEETAELVYAGPQAYFVEPEAEAEPEVGEETAEPAYAEPAATEEAEADAEA